ncbi:TIGR01459 family HAD-type hydrolase [Acidisphaera sp. L21]|uniref:TIGR01459 family HAD-type hydrolase n=1 Tax=Acidisphaera sp. L21 TaxID=1641851 RepID=UPI00131CA310|nr:TIGR01459 family HAD-type hydrolase [Acidisphaera sp. L21]
MTSYPGMATLADRYDGFILDLWGVIHDGVNPYPGAADCLAQLRDAGKRCVLLSNAPRRNFAAEKMLRRMGLEGDLYTGVLTSGEAVHLELQRRTDPWFAGLGRRVWHLGPERDRNVIEGLDLEQVATPAEADFVLNTGPDDHRGPTSVEPFEELLQDCARHSLPMICANPDLEVIRGGVRVICAGALGERYQQMGGTVRSIGKPDPVIYGPVMEMLGTPKHRTIAVGDSLRTDIAGAAAAGIDSCWVLGGIHGEALGDDHGAAQAEAHAAGLSPVAIVPRFVW